ncbi:unnamed protein product [Hermetia illucens]|uniref:Homeobox domain-containing protein n=1 Tax=Hermetia illucens TaxID=343691 RepID=A0A7R8UMB4_HERIL|nr:unnamed protein product [Hermetia illucens]
MSATSNLNKRTRTKFTAEQLRVLEQFVTNTGFFMKKDYEELGAQLALPENVVRNFVQNRRSLQVKQGLRAPIRRRKTKPCSTASTGKPEYVLNVSYSAGDFGELLEGNINIINIGASAVTPQLELTFKEALHDHTYAKRSDSFEQFYTSDDDSDTCLSRNTLVGDASTTSIQHREEIMENCYEIWIEDDVLNASCDEKDDTDRPQQNTSVSLDNTLTCTGEHQLNVGLNNPSKVLIPPGYDDIPQALIDHTYAKSASPSGPDTVAEGDEYSPQVEKIDNVPLTPSETRCHGDALGVAESCASKKISTKIELPDMDSSLQPDFGYIPPASSFEDLSPTNSLENEAGSGSGPPSDDYSTLSDFLGTISSDSSRDLFSSQGSPENLHSADVLDNFTFDNSMSEIMNSSAFSSLFTSNDRTQPMQDYGLGSNSDNFYNAPNYANVQDSHLNYGNVDDDLGAFNMSQSGYSTNDSVGYHPFQDNLDDLANYLW